MIFLRPILFITLFISCRCSFAQLKQPNILFIMSDDHAYQAISAYQKDYIETPNIDALADKGCAF